MTDEKKILSLNPIESVGYECLKYAFIGTFMIKDFINNCKKDIN